MTDQHQGSYQQPANPNSPVNQPPTTTPHPGPLFPPVQHGHNGKKSIKEYLFEFVLIFTAVVLGFMADSFRENLEDGQKEKKYMKSLITDISNDYRLSKDLATALMLQIRTLDSLEEILTSPAVLFNQDSVLKCYQLSTSILTFYPEFFLERTINQLLSSGSMRLIRSQDIADSVMAYHSYIKFLDVQRQLYISSMNDCSASMYNIFDVAYLRTYPSDDGKLYYMPIDLSGIKLLTTRSEDVKKFVATLERSKLVAANYKGMMKELEARADRLFTFLSKVYDK